MQRNITNTVLLTRQRWDAWMLPLFVASVVIGMCDVLLTDQARHLTAPLPVLILWGLLRIFTPAIVLVSTCGMSLLLAMMAMMLDVCVFGQPYGAKLEPYHAVLFAPSIVTLVAGVALAEMQARARRDEAKGRC